MNCRPLPFLSSAPLARVTAALVLALLLAACGHPAPHGATAPAEVFLLVGQSNMSGRGLGPDPQADLPADPRLLMWDPAGGHLAEAREPLPHQDLGSRPVAAGPGLSFGRGRLRSAPPGMRVVLVPAAFGGTGFSDRHGSWRVTGGRVSPLTLEAVRRANAAMHALRLTGAPVRFAGILWHQGETDAASGLPSDAYVVELEALVRYLRNHIEGAGPGTPFVLGQYVPARIAASSALAALAALNRTLPQRLGSAGCAGSVGLSGNPAPDTIHFDAASQRMLGERYAAALALVERGVASDCPWS